MMVNKDPEQRPSAADLLKHSLMEQWMKLHSSIITSPRDPLSLENGHCSSKQVGANDPLQLNSLNIIAEE